MTRRMERVAEAIREIVASAILFETKDPRVSNVTVVRCEVAPDLRRCQVHVSIMGDEKQRKLCLHGLNSARGFLQKRIGEQMTIRYTPLLEFVEDESVKKHLEIARLLREVLPEGDAPMPNATAEDDEEINEDDEEIDEDEDEGQQPRPLPAS